MAGVVDPRIIQVAALLDCMTSDVVPQLESVLAKLATARDDALEEAAKLIEDNGKDSYQNCTNQEEAVEGFALIRAARSIRELKSTELGK